MRVLHRCRTAITNQHKTAGRPNVAGILLNVPLAGGCSYVAIAFWRCAAGEIDLIVKRRRIRSAAALFLAKYPEISDAQCRFDLLIINHGRIFGVGRIVHLKNAWQ
jgi:Holliday junction resolvase-like predicted endonuclease